VARDRQLSCTFCRGQGSNCLTCWGIQTYCPFCRFCSQCGIDHHAGAAGRTLRATLRDAGPTPLCMSHSTQHCDEGKTGCSIFRESLPSKELAKYRFCCSHCPLAFRSAQALSLHSHAHFPETKGGLPKLAASTAKAESVALEGKAQAGRAVLLEGKAQAEVAVLRAKPPATRLLGPATCHPLSASHLPTVTWYVTNKSKRLLGRFYKGPEQLLFDPPPPRSLPSYTQWRQEFKESTGIQALQCSKLSCSVCQGLHPGSQYFDCPLLSKIRTREARLDDMTCLKCLCLKKYHGLHGKAECFLVSTKSAQWNLLCGKENHPSVHHRICHTCFQEQTLQTSQHLASLLRRIDPLYRGGESSGIRPPDEASPVSSPDLSPSPTPVKGVCHLCTSGKWGKDGVVNMHGPDARCVLNKNSPAPAAYQPQWPPP
jgi:hypothetical protein